MRIEGRVAVVTGAASGIGRATAVALARAGARGVALADLDAAGLAQTGALVEGEGSRALARPTDVRSAGALAGLFEDTAAALGDLTILHSNAGVATGSPVWPELPIEQVERLVDVNLKGVVLGARLALDPMRRAGGGVIVNTASIAAHTAIPDEAVYCATKAGVEMFTRCCAPLAKSHGVRVCCVCPGLVDTPLLRDRDAGEMFEHIRPAFHALQVLAPEDIAAAVIALVEDDSAIAKVVDVPSPPRVRAGPRS
jgi:3-oxoacyl-[acyl-carrier protein] reductase